MSDERVYATEEFSGAENYHIDEQINEFLVRVRKYDYFHLIDIKYFCSGQSWSHSHALVIYYYVKVKENE